MVGGLEDRDKSPDPRRDGHEGEPVPKPIPLPAPKEEVDEEGTRRESAVSSPAVNCPCEKAISAESRSEGERPRRLAVGENCSNGMPV